MTLRRAALDDIPAIQRLHLLLCESERQFGFMVSLTWTYSPQGEAYFRDSIQSLSSVVAVVVDESEVVGYMIGGLDPQNPRVARLVSICVDESHRRSGIGLSLVQHFLDWTVRQDAGQVMVSVAAENAPALGLYRKAGFVESSVCDGTAILNLTW